jgi:hypothetical protein
MSRVFPVMNSSFQGPLQAGNAQPLPSATCGGGVVTPSCLVSMVQDYCGSSTVTVLGVKEPNSKEHLTIASIWGPLCLVWSFPEE